MVKERTIEWKHQEFRRLRNKMFKSTATEKEEEKFHELRKEFKINWDGEV